MCMAAPALWQPQFPVTGAVLQQGQLHGPLSRTIRSVKPHARLSLDISSSPVPGRGQPWYTDLPWNTESVELVVPAEHTFRQCLKECPWQKGAHTHIPGANEDGDHIRLWLLWMFILHLLQKLTEPLSLLDREEQRKLMRYLTPQIWPLEKLAEPGNPQHSWRADLALHYPETFQEAAFPVVLFKAFSLCIALTNAELVRKKSFIPPLSIWTFSVLASPQCFLCPPASVAALRCSVSPFRQHTCSFSGYFQNREEINIYKGNYCPSTVPLSTQECPIVLLPPGYLLQAGRKKHHLRTLESEKTYSFRCVFSFSVSRTITSLFGSFWDLMSCKTEQKAGCHELQSLK